MSIKARNVVVLLLKTTSILLGPLNDAFTEIQLLSEPFSSASDGFAFSFIILQNQWHYP